MKRLTVSTPYGPVLPDERKAEAATLFAEYAMDFATQAAQYALSTALQALILQQPAESTDKE